MVGTPWLTILGRMVNAGVSKDRDQSTVSIKGLYTSDAEERSEEEDSRELEEDDDETSKLVNKLHDFNLSPQVEKETPRPQLLIKGQSLEILVPPPQV